MTGKRGYSAKRDIRAAMLGSGSSAHKDIVEWLHKKGHTKVKKGSVKMWLNRNAEDRDEMLAELALQQIDLDNVSEEIFKKGVFENYPMVQKWWKLMVLGDVQDRNGNVNKLKALCQGRRKNMSPITQLSYQAGDRQKERELGHKGTGIDLTEHGWIPIHPQRLTIDHVQDYVFMMKDNYPDVDNAGARLAARSFFENNGIPVAKTISGKKHKSAEKYAKLYFDRETLEPILKHLRKTDFEAYVVTYFMFKTGTRISATLDANLKDLRNYGTENWELTVWDKAVRSKHADGKKWEKFISPDIYKEIALLTDHPNRTTGKIFTKTDKEMAVINGETIDEFIPQFRTITKGRDGKAVAPMYPRFKNVNHFWRHMFAQHMLRATNWNYGIVASLGGWDVSSLTESYGMPTLEVVRDWGSNVIQKLGTKELDDEIREKNEERSLKIERRGRR
jgi:integrase